jgi:protocatechuate 3,4-dioxygenase beta subunit
MKTLRVAIVAIAVAVLVFLAVYFLRERESAPESVATQPKIAAPAPRFDDAKASSQADPSSKLTVADPVAATAAPRSILVRGRVVDARTNEPVANAEVADRRIERMYHAGLLAATPADRPEERAEVEELIADEKATTDKDGKYSLSSEIVGGTLTCTAAGYATVEKTLPAAVDGTISLDFRLTPGGSVAGRVVEKGSDRPVAGVRVDAAPLSAPAFQFQVEAMASALTDDSGAFLVRDLGAGTYKLYADVHERGFLFNLTWAPAVTIEAGVESKGAVLYVAQGGVVGGTVSDSSGNPIENADVSIDLMDGADVLMDYDSLSWGSKTGPDGQYRIPGLLPDVELMLVAEHEQFSGVRSEAFRIDIAQLATTMNLQFPAGVRLSGTARKPDGAPAAGMAVELVRPEKDGYYSAVDDESRYAETGDDGSFTFENVPKGSFFVGRKLIEVGNADIEGLEITLDEDADRAASGPTTDTISGEVLTQDGSPASGVTVDLHVPDSEWAVGYDDTKADGQFSIAVEEKGPFSVRAYSELGEVKQDNVLPGGSVTLQLGPPTRILGTVIDEQGKKLGGCQVSLRREESDTEFDPNAVMQAAIIRERDLNKMGSGTSDDQGKFEYVNVDSGWYTITALASGVGKGTSERFVVKGHQTIEVVVPVKAGAAFAGIVVDSKNQFVEGATVSLHWMSSAHTAAPRFLAEGSPLRDTVGAAQSGPDGKFSVPGITKGSYAVTIEHANYAHYHDASIRVEENGKNDYHAVMRMPCRLKGQYVENGEGRENVKIYLSGVDGQRWTKTDNDGRFEFAKIPPGPYSVLAAAQQNLEGSGDSDDSDSRDERDRIPQERICVRNVTLKEGQSADILFGTGVSVGGILKGLNGEHAYVRLMHQGAPDMAGMTELETMTSGIYQQYVAGGAEVEPDGSFVMEDVEVGTYILEVHMSGQSQDPDEDALGSPRLRQEIAVGNGPMSVEFELPSLPN